MRIYMEFIFPRPPCVIEPIRRKADVSRRIPLEARMLDAIFLTAGLAFFALCVGYTLICEKL